MSTNWLTTIKPSFQTEWLMLPPKEMRQVLEKIHLLSQDPTPDAKVKKQLKYMDGKLHRIRCGDYRIFYTFQHPYISLLALYRRDDDTYNEDIDAEWLGGYNPELKYPERASQASWNQIMAPNELAIQLLPKPITEELITNLHISQQYHAVLLAIKTEDELLNCPDVPGTMLEMVLNYIFPPTLEHIVQQPDYLLQDINDLQRFKEGELTDFLLKLSPEQEKVVNWALNSSGPTQVKGSPGTGKSTVALYRVRSLIQRFQEMGQPAPRILYTTYTNALVKSSEQLLKRLLYNDFSCVLVKTPDSIVREIHLQKYKDFRVARGGILNGALIRAMKQLELENNPLVKTLERLNHDYLLEEVCEVIIARNITTQKDYLATKRKGRKFELNPAQKEAVWQVYELFLQELKKINRNSWQQTRLDAEAIFAKGPSLPQYDAVVVDEAQDLDPSVMRLLVGLCKTIDRFFITADANQSIYKVAFSWSDVHESLKFQGRRTIVLCTNYRSTRQVSEVAQSYLANGALETEAIKSVHMYSGPIPAVRTAQNEDEEIQLLASFLRGTARECHLRFGSYAVLCPTHDASKKIAEGLRKQGMKATFITRKDVDLEYPGVKVMTIHSSKGLEFPGVALAGFFNSRYANVSEHDQNEGYDEILQRDRRTLFVGMTRAMRTLFVITPVDLQSSLLIGFDSTYWNLE